MRSTPPLALNTVGGSSSWKTQYRPRESTFTDIGFPFSEPTPSSVPSVTRVRIVIVHRGQLASLGTTLGAGAWAATGCAAMTAKTMRWWRRCVILPPVFVGPILGRTIEDLADGRNQWRTRRMLAAVPQIETIVEARWIAALRVLEDGLELVQRLG